MEPADTEEKVAFKELHEKLLLTNQRIKFTNLQIDSLRRKSRYTTLTKQELEKVPEDVKTYVALGRAFALTPREEVFENLNKVSSDTEQKLTIMENNKKYLEGKLKESKDNLREMVQHKRNIGEDQPSSSKD